MFPLFSGKKRCRVKSHRISSYPSRVRGFFSFGDNRSDISQGWEVDILNDTNLGTLRTLLMSESSPEPGSQGKTAWTSKKKHKDTSSSSNVLT